MKKSRIFLLATILIMFIFANSAEAIRLTPGTPGDKMDLKNVVDRLADMLNNNFSCIQHSVFSSNGSYGMDPFNILKKKKGSTPIADALLSLKSDCLIADLIKHDRPFFENCKIRHQDSSIPEPATCFLLGWGLLAISLIRSRFKR